MHTTDSIGAPGAAIEPQRTMREIDAAISLLRQGIARRVYLCGFDMGNGLAGMAEARAQEDGLTIHVDVVDGCPALVLRSSGASGSSTEQRRDRE